MQSAETLLDRLGATEERAHQLARFPLHPRLSRILIAAMERGVGEDGCIAAALLGWVSMVKNDLLAAIDWTRITGRGNRLSSCADLPVLPGKRNTMMTHC